MGYKKSFPVFENNICLFQPGDRVKFVPTSYEEFDHVYNKIEDGSYDYNIVDYQKFSVKNYKKWLTTIDSNKEILTMIKVIKKGLETSVQDYPGRIGTLNQGFPPSGPMDSWSFRLANVLVQNDPGAPALECQFMGPSLKFENNAIIAITGANMDPKIDGKPIPLWESIKVEKDQILEMSFATIGARSYIAFSGGINSKPWLGSRSTFHKAGVGGMDGKAIQDGQEIKINKSKSEIGRKIKNEFIPKFSKDKTWEVEVVKGPNDDWIDDNGHKMFLNTNWKLQSKSDRTGYRLEGPNWTFTEKATNKGLEHGSEAIKYY